MIRKESLFFILIVFLVGCTPLRGNVENRLSFYPDEVKESDLEEDDFVSIDENGVDKSVLDRANRDHTKFLGLDFYPRTIVVAAGSPENKSFLNQMKIINSGAIGIEEGNQFVIVLATVEGPIPRSDYCTTKEQAKKLLGQDSFKILFYDRDGQFVESHTDVMKGPAILAVLDKIN